MTRIIYGQKIELAEGPMGIRVYPPEALVPTLKAYRARMFGSQQWAKVHKRERKKMVKKGRRKKEKSDWGWSGE